MSRYRVSGPELQELPQLPTDRINDAVEWLYGQGHVDRHRPIGGVRPFTFKDVDPKVQGRVFLQTLQEDSEDAARRVAKRLRYFSRKGDGRRPGMYHHHQDFPVDSFD